MVTFKPKSRHSGSVARFFLVLSLTFIGTFLLTMVASSVVIAIWGETRETIITTTALQNVLMFCFSAIFAAAMTMPDPMRFTGLSGHTELRAILGVILIWLVSMPMLNEIIVWNESIHFPLSMSAIEEALREMEEANNAVAEEIMATSSIGGMIVNILFVGLLTGFSEELFFRGALQRGFDACGINRHLSIWITALIFSAVHFQFFGFVPRLLIGAMFGYMLMWTGSIYPGAFAHALNNSAVVVTTWMTQNGYTDLDFEHFGVSTDSFGWMGIVSALLFFAVIYKRNIFFRKL